MDCAITVFSVTHLVNNGCADLLVEGILKLQAERDSLKAQVESLRENLSINRKHRSEDINDLQEICDSNTALREQNMRLRHAGNEMSEWIQNEVAGEVNCLDPVDLANKWEAAKEGKKL